MKICLITESTRPTSSSTTNNARQSIIVRLLYAFVCVVSNRQHKQNAFNITWLRRSVVNRQQTKNKQKYKQNCRVQNTRQQTNKKCVNKINATIIWIAAIRQTIHIKIDKQAPPPTTSEATEAIATTATGGRRPPVPSIHRVIVENTRLLYSNTYYYWNCGCCGLTGATSSPW